MKRWLLSDLSDCVEKELAAIGLKPKTVQMYHYWGLVPIMRYYAAMGKRYYAKGTTQKYISEMRKAADDGLIPDAKRRTIRKIAVFMAEYVETGAIFWHSLAREGVRQLTKPFSMCFERYVCRLTENGYSPTTLRGKKPMVKQFLHYIEDCNIRTVAQITKPVVLSYLPIMSGKYTRVGDALSVLRSFLSFLYAEGMLDTDIAPLLQVTPAGRRKYYFGFTQQEASEILAAIDQETLCGKRDYAILMLAMHTGLRAVDVLNLKLGDIHWASKELRIVQHKTGKALTLPLDTSVGNAIARYILDVRPDCESSELFLRAKSPYRKLESWSGYSIVKRAAKKAGITWTAESHKGFHSFRRSIGAWMLEAEIPLSTISEILGHSNVDSSRPYIMTHRSKLEICSLTLHGIEPAGREQL